MQNIIIVGNGGAALECHVIANDMLSIPSFKSQYRFKGFLAHNGHKGDLGELAGLEIGQDTDYEIMPDDVFAIGIGDNGLRLEAYRLMEARGARFINLISPWAYVAPDTIFKDANIIGIGCHISNRVTLGNCNYLNGEVRLGHHANVGDGNFFAPRSMCMGNVKIADKNSFGPACIVLENARIGSGNKIAPAAVVYKGCKNNSIMAGNPALKVD